MALFELENGRLIPAQFGRDVPEGFTDDVLEAIRSQVLEIVSRPLFPIAWSNEGHSESTQCSRLTGLDASGQVVAVEVMRRLDSEVLIDSLSRLSETASLSWGDLARQYPMGPEGFRREWVMFREAMPPSPPNGPRLILVTTEIADEIRPALDVLSSSGIEVHHMTLRQMTNGRAFLDVEAVGPRIYGHRANTLLETSSVIPAIGSAQKENEEGAGSESAQERPEELRTVDEVGEVVVEDSAFEPEPNKDESFDETVIIEGPVVLAESEEDERVSSDQLDEIGASATDQLDAERSEEVAVSESTSETDELLVGEPLVEVPLGAESSFDEPALEDVTVEVEPPAVTGPAPLALPPELATDELPGEVVDEPTFPVPLPSRRSLRDAVIAQHRASVSESEPVRQGTHRVPPPPPLPTRRSIRTTFARHESTETGSIPLPTRSERHRGEMPVIPVGEDVSDLGLIAAAAGGDVPLFLKTGEETPDGATLTVRGLIVVPSGEYSDPLSALVAEGLEAIDGWRDWHLASPEGPTLADALQELGAR